MTRTDGVAVRRRARRIAHAGVAAGADLVLDDELLAEFFRQLLPDQPRHHIDRAAGRERHDDPDRLRGILLGGRRSGERQQRKRRKTAKDRVHGFLLRLPTISSS
jgi:hypothetical protein